RRLAPGRWTSDVRPALRLAQDVADAEHRLDVIGVVGVLLQLLPEAMDVDLDQVLVARPGEAPDVLHDGAIGEDAALIEHEVVEDLELEGGEADLLLVALEAAGAQVEGQGAGVELLAPAAAAGGEGLGP